MGVVTVVDGWPLLVLVFRERNTGTAKHVPFKLVQVVVGDAPGPVELPGRVREVTVLATTGVQLNNLNIMTPALVGRAGEDGAGMGHAVVASNASAFLL